jgi:hypothetical protein
MILSAELIEFLGKKFFPHLTPTYQRLAILEVLARLDF